MSGARIQLAAIGSQDVYLTGNPEITLFKSSYKRHTHFSISTQKILITKLDFGSLQSGIVIPPSGDLISKMTLVLEFNKHTDENIEWGYVNKLGHALIKNISITVDGVEISKHEGEWINIFDELFNNKSHNTNYNNMIGNLPDLKNFNKSHNSFQLFIPLNFWFSRDSGSTFPICALKNSSLTINIEICDKIDCINWKGSLQPELNENFDLKDQYLLVDYIHLDEIEKNLFMERTHDYLIEQVITIEQPVENNNKDVISLNNFNYRTMKALIWYVNLEKYLSNQDNEEEIQRIYEFLEWAPDDDWNKSLNNFGKLIWLVTRKNLNTNDINNPVIDLNNDFINIGESIPVIENGLPVLEKLSKEVKAIFLFAEKNSVTNTFQANATIDNVILLENTLTFEDMSATILELKDGFNYSDIHDHQTTFLDINKVNIKDIFNYGNFINRSDNPLVESELQIDSIPKIESKDGFFYNYLIPFQYFTNTPPDGINAYSFALSPCSLNLTGILDMKNINSASLSYKIGKYNKGESDYFSKYFKSGRIKVFGIYYSILNIDKGIVTVKEHS